VAAGVDPSAAVPPGRAILEIADDLVVREFCRCRAPARSRVPVQMPSTGSSRVLRDLLHLRAGSEKQKVSESFDSFIVNVIVPARSLKNRLRLSAA
jgi:hypothetical protein